MVHQYQEKANKSRRIQTIKKNQDKVKSQYQLLHKYQAQIKKSVFCFSIGTKNAFQKGDAYEYEESKEEKEVYICKKGTESCGANQVLVLRRENKWWIAWAADATDQKKIIYGAPVFRTEAEEITTNNCAHMWQWNSNTDARSNDEGNWSGKLWCKTRVNEVEDTQKDQPDENMDDA